MLYNNYNNNFVFGANMRPFGFSMKYPYQKNFHFIFQHELDMILADKVFRWTKHVGVVWNFWHLSQILSDKAGPHMLSLGTSGIIWELALGSKKRLIIVKQGNMDLIKM